MRRLLLIAGDIAAGKTTFSRQLAQRYGIAAFQKDSVKEVLSDCIGFSDRAENKRLSDAAVAVLRHIFLEVAETGRSLILEANFHPNEQQALLELAAARQYDVLTLILRGDAEELYRRYLRRMNSERRHPTHLTTTLHVREDFLRAAARARAETMAGNTLTIDATDFSYQTDATVLSRLDAFMGR